MSTAHVLLGLLADGEPRHGYELKHAHDARLPRARPLAFGQVYATLGRLVRDALIVQADRSTESGPERTSYTITDAGRGRLTEWLSAVDPPAPYATDTLYTKVAVALLAAPDAGTAREYLTRQREAHGTRMRELTRAKTDPSATMADVLAADYLLAHLDADLTWMRTTLSRLASAAGTPPGGSR